MGQSLGRAPARAALVPTDINDGIITSSHIADGTVVAQDVAANAITASELADDAVDTAAIAADAVTGAKLANDIAINTSGAITTTGAFTSIGIDDNANALAITIDDSEHVGIGNSPSAEPLLTLHNQSAVTELRLNSTGTAQAQIKIQGGTTATSTWQIAGTNDPKFSISKWNGSAYSENLVINSSGNVGVGTDPDVNLHLESTTTAEPVLQLEQFTNDATSAELKFINGQGGGNAGVAGHDLGRLTFTGNLSNGAQLKYAEIYSEIKDPHATTGKDGKIGFKINCLNTDTEVMSITASGDDADGRVGIGTTAPGHMLVAKGAAGTSPAFEMINSDTEDGDTGRESSIRFSGFRSGGEAMINAQIGGHHDGSADDDKGMLLFATNGGSGHTERMRIDSSGHITPGANGTQNLGSSSLRWANIYSADLQLSNEGTGGNEVDGTEGNWTIQEGDENLFVLNRKTGKKFKINLTEI